MLIQSAAIIIKNKFNLIQDFMILKEQENLDLITQGKQSDLDVNK
jgi:hypothetical protein